jgi:hypothetical protein
MISGLHRAVYWVLGLVLGLACTDVGDYSTGPGECYFGQMVSFEYLTSGEFGEHPGLELILDVDALGSAQSGTSITTTNLLFERADVIQMDQLIHDSLSLLQFPTGRVRNYLAFAQPKTGGPAVVTVSLMENNEVEVRILRPDMDPYDGVDTSIFGVFQMVRKRDCSQ